MSNIIKLTVAVSVIGMQNCNKARLKLYVHVSSKRRLSDVFLRTFPKLFPDLVLQTGCSLTKREFWLSRIFREKKKEKTREKLPEDGKRNGKKKKMERARATMLYL